jgi:fructose/tagatose bisphosphate aldolase
MALVSMRELLDHAAVNTYGIPAFNVNNLEQVQAVMEADQRSWLGMPSNSDLTNQAKTSNPCFFTTASNLSAMPLGCLLPDSHF